MKPDLNDDFDLERRLRNSVAGRRPIAPVDLRDFIGQVPSAPAAGPDRLGFGRSVDRRRMRRGVAGVAVAAAFVLAIAGSAALMAIRQSPATSQRPGATSPTAQATSAFDFVTGDWGWRRVADPAPGVVAPVTNGYLGECLANGAPAACSSRDGVAWTMPPDPAVLAVGGRFAGWSVTHGAASWVAAGTVDPGTWRSSDGVHWSAVAVDLPGLQRAEVQALPAGFAMVARTYVDGQSSSRLLTSPDGATWTPLDLPAGVSALQPGGAIGLMAVRGDQANGSSVARPVSSADGLSWMALTLPDGVQGLSTTIRLADGSYVGIGTVGTMVTSTDGVTWRASAGPGSPVDSLAVVGGRLVAIARVPSTDF